MWRKNVANNGHRTWWLEAGQPEKVAIGKWGKTFLVMEYKYKGAESYAEVDGGRFYNLKDAKAFAERMYIK